MSTTLEIPKDLLEPVKSKSKRERRSIPTTAELYQAWLDGAITLPPRPRIPKPPPPSREEQTRQDREWVKNFEKLVDAFAHIPVADSRTCSEIIMEDRNRLERKNQ